MFGKSVVIVLIGPLTATRDWILYEIKKGWSLNKGVFGIHIHNLLDSNGFQSVQGKNPFQRVQIGNSNMSNIVKAYNPPYTKSNHVYQYIKNNLQHWIEESIGIRNKMK